MTQGTPGQTGQIVHCHTGATVLDQRSRERADALRPPYASVRSFRGPEEDRELPHALRSECGERRHLRAENGEQNKPTHRADATPLGRGALGADEELRELL